MFDRMDARNLGRPLYWSLDHYVRAVEEMIMADEIEFAFKMLDNPPAWYRENYPAELTEIKETLFKNLYSPMTYASDKDEAGYTYAQVVEQVSSGYCYPRLDILKGLITDMNKLGKKPWLFELSTSHGPIPIGLRESGCEFDFCAKNFNQAALAKVREWLDDIWLDEPQKGQPTIFVNFESLEHAYRQEDVKNDFYKLGVDFDHILLSVPNGCLGGGLENWRTRRLGHLRGYTVKEFSALAMSFFHGYEWRAWPSVSIVLHGQRNR